MRIIKYINTLAITLPFLIAATYPIYKEGALIFAVISTMATGFLQFSLGIKMLIDNPKNKNIQLYIAGVVAFFALWLIDVLIGYNDFINFILLPIPLILAIYLSLLIYTKE